VALLTKTAETKAEDSQAVINALVGLEKTMRAEAKLDAGLSRATLEALDGAWRLVFTTGTADIQKKVRLPPSSRLSSTAELACPAHTQPSPACTIPLPPTCGSLRFVRCVCHAVLPCPNTHRLAAPSATSL
jgi:hypothetical protein